jgi:hypothetical protein
MRRLVAPLLGLLVAGCVTASVHRLDQAIRPPSPPEAIEVLEASPDSPYTVIAHIESQTSAVFRGSDDLRRLLVEKAAELGGDALILGPEEEESTPIILPTAMIMSTEKKLEADVIVFDRAPAPAVPDGA